MSDIIIIRKLEQLGREVEELKSEANRTPLRIEPSLPKREIHKAFCKTDAPTDSNIIVCYLDVDLTGPEIEVHCQYIFSASVLSECYPLLAQHDPIDVYYAYREWRCDWWFNGYIECDLE